MNTAVVSWRQIFGKDVKVPDFNQLTMDQLNGISMFFTTYTGEYGSKERTPIIMGRPGSGILGMFSYSPGYYMLITEDYDFSDFSGSDRGQIKSVQLREVDRLIRLLTFIR